MLLRLADSVSLAVLALQRVAVVVVGLLARALRLSLLLLLVLLLRVLVHDGGGLVKQSDGIAEI